MIFHYFYQVTQVYNAGLTFPGRIHPVLIQLIDIISSSGTTLSKLQSVFTWAMKILNILVVIGAIYAGANIANSMFGLSGDDHFSGKGKGKLLALIFGLIVWFGIQVIIGDIGNVMK